MGGARDEILASVRQALAGVERSVSAVPRGYREVPAGEDMVRTFAERVEDYGGTVHRCALDEVPARIAEAVGGRATVVPADLGWPVPGAEPDAGRAALELDRFEAVVTAAACGIATTGTVVLDHGPGQGRRALSLVPDLHVCVVRADQVVPDVPDAVRLLDPLRPQTWISGPSATSDIELDRVEGVHGPRTLVVLLVG